MCVRFLLLASCECVSARILIVSLPKINDVIVTTDEHVARANRYVEGKKDNQLRFACLPCMWNAWSEPLISFLLLLSRRLHISAVKVASIKFISDYSHIFIAICIWALPTTHTQTHTAIRSTHTVLLIRPTTINRKTEKKTYSSILLYVVKLTTLCVELYHFYMM